MASHTSSTRVRNQHGSTGQCAIAGCGLPVKWNVYTDQWDHTMTRAEFEDRLRASGFANVRGQELFPAGVASLVVAE